MTDELERLKAENAELRQRISAHESPFDFENAITIGITVEDESSKDVRSAKILVVNDCEFVSAGIYQQLISKYFKEVEEGLVARSIASRMASSIEDAVSANSASNNMIDSLSDWNRIVVNK